MQTACDGAAGKTLIGVEKRRASEVKVTEDSKNPAVREHRRLRRQKQREKATIYRKSWTETNTFRLHKASTKRPDEKTATDEDE